MPFRAYHVDRRTGAVRWTRAGEVVEGGDDLRWMGEAEAGHFTPPLPWNQLLALAGCPLVTDPPR